MKLGLFGRSRPAVERGSDGTLFLDVEGRRIPVELRPRKGSSRMTLRADPARGVVRVALHPRTSASRALAFVAEHRDWIAARVAGWPAARPFVPGTAFPLQGHEVVIDWSSDRPRTPRLEGDRLLVGGPLDGVPGRIERWLRVQAKAVLDAETRSLATRVGKPVRAVAVRDTTSRWGSCTAGGAVAYSWRLILAPPQVRASVVAHEVAHLVHMDHGPDFWALAEELLGADHGPARRWLKRHGPGLHWFGRSL